MFSHLTRKRDLPANTRLIGHGHAAPGRDLTRTGITLHFYWDSVGAPPVRGVLGVAEQKAQLLPRQDGWDFHLSVM